MNRCCVIIVTYNAVEWLDKCLKPFENLPSNWEVVIVDNNSSDNTCKVIKEQYSYVKLFETTQNLGFGKANNVGLKYAQEKDYEHILLLNQDAWISINDIQQLIDIQNKYPEYYIVSPLHCNENYDKLDFNFSNYAKSIEGLIDDALLNNYKKEIYDASFINAAIWLLNKKCLRNIGAFNPSFFHYGEDNNYLHRLFYHGGKLGLVPNIRAVHSREFRKFKRDFNFVYRQKVLIPLSDPNTVKDKDYLIMFYKLLLKSILYLLCFNFKRFLLYKNLFLEYVKNKKIIYKNMMISKNKQYSFLTEKIKDITNSPQTHATVGGVIPLFAYKQLAA